jgi:hypothetical protein
MCLAHSRYAGCNNNMGVEVSWRQIKRVCPSLASLTEFIGALCKFIRRQLGEEHRDRLRKKATATLSFAIRLQPSACTTRFRMCTPRPSARAL